MQEQVQQDRSENKRIFQKKNNEDIEDIRKVQRETEGY